ncbi:MAG TPA: phosphopantetheine-binding protein, partial [Nevskiaceae bacterium]|nr:phosphopantetheine-binding protein [Nevskiaceae bacterium]
HTTAAARHKLSFAYRDDWIEAIRAPGNLMTDEERELAELLISALQLEDKDAATIDPELALFGEYDSSWGLDSIDALEIALAIQQRYGIEMRAEDESSHQAFASLRSLNAFIHEHQVA